MRALKRSQSAFVGFRARSSCSAQQGRQCSSWSKPLPKDSIEDRQQTINTNQIAGTDMLLQELGSVKQLIDPEKRAQEASVAAAKAEATLKQVESAAEVTAASGPLLAKLEAIEARLTKLDEMEARQQPMDMDELNEGDAVEANFKGRGQWYCGNITKCNAKDKHGRIVYDVEKILSTLSTDCLSTDDVYQQTTLARYQQTVDKMLSTDDEKKYITYDIMYGDKTKENGVGPECIRCVDKMAKLEEKISMIHSDTSKMFPLLMLTAFIVCFHF
jgi:hypothetical protein